MRSDSEGGYKQRDVERGFTMGMTRETIRSGVSTSGKERNHLFMGVEGRDFVERSGVSGLDSVADGRAFAWLDYDQDGMLDVAVVNANAPLLQLFRNQLPSRGFVAFDLVGGNDRPVPSKEWSNRDAIGARITVHTDAGAIVRELHAGEGFAAQNSRRVHIGLGDETVEHVGIRWPSGRETELDSVPSGSVVTVFEDPSQAARIHAVSSSRALSAAPNADQVTSVALYVTTATWCGSCKQSLPDLRRLRETFDEDALGMFAVPVGEPPRVLEAYWEREHPPHQLLNVDEDGAIITSVLAEAGAALPWSVVTDRDGAVLASFAGVPTVSRLQELMGDPTP